MLFMCAISVFLVAFFIFLKYSFWRQKCCQQLPGTPPSLFNVFGVLGELLFSKDIHIGVVNLLRKRNELHQKDKLFCVWASYIPFVCLVKAEAIKDLLRNNKMNEKAFIYDWFEPALGKGLITSSAEKAKYRRKLLMPSFHPDVLKTHIGIFNDYSQKLVDILKEETNRDFSCIKDAVRNCTLDIIHETMLGNTLDALKYGNSIFETIILRSEEILMSRIYKPWMWPDFIFWNSKDGKELKQYLDFHEQIMKKVFQEKKEKYLRGESEIHSGKYKAFLEILLEKSFETQQLSEEDIMEEAKTFILAGHETVAATVMWSLYLIGHHPKVQAKIHEEINQIFGEDVQRPVTEMDLIDLRYLDCALKETVRLYPAVPQSGRKATQDTNICGYVIPKGASVIILTYFLHRDENVFPEPNKFDPDRFLPENAVNIPEYAYIPFSSGPRGCPGYKFAKMELKTLICYILRNFTVESLDEREKMERELTFKLALVPASPIRLKFRSRAFKNRAPF